jgi:hypothetical protein
LRFFVVQLLDDTADALLAHVSDGRVVLAFCRFWKLNEDKFAFDVVLLVQVQDRLGSCAGAGEEVEDDITIRNHPFCNSFH